MNKKLHLGIYTVAFGLAVLGVILICAVGVLAPNSKSTIIQAIATLSAWAIIGFFFFLSFYPLVLLAKMWAAIQDDMTSVSPAKAIGFLFIPFFNLFWIFRVWAGYADEYDNYVLRHDLQVAPLERGIFVVYPIFALLGGLLIFPLIAVPFLLFPMIRQVCDAVNGVRTAKVVVWVK
jgi:hypothetical protein